jgi:monothiol glutaredoxin
MSLDSATRQRIEEMIASNDVVLFMKGNREAPQCGFSSTVVGILDSLIADYATADVLSDSAVREGIKEYSQWPTIPQLYVRGEFLGGCDIVQELAASGELAQSLGVDASSPSKQLEPSGHRRAVPEQALPSTSRSQ